MTIVNQLLWQPRKRNKKKKKYYIVQRDSEGRKINNKNNRKHSTETIRNRTVMGILENKQEAKKKKILRKTLVSSIY